MSRKLLLADDSATIQRVIEMTFSGEDVQVVTVGDGEEAIARIPIEKPDIILADIAMPKRSGYEVSTFVKGHPEFSKIPVLLLAGAFEPVDDAKAKEAKCDGVLVKPFEPQQVIARVHELLGGAKGSPTQSAVSDILRPAAALAPPRPVELPKREERPPIPDDLMDVGEEDLLPRFEDVQVEPETSVAPPLVMDDSLDDYFDKLDEAFATINTGAQSPPAGASAPHMEARAPRSEGPVLERDLESFDEPMTIDTSVHIESSFTTDADPFAGLDSLQPETAALPTLDDLLAGMPGGGSSVPDISFDDDLTATEMMFDAPPAIDLSTPAPQLGLVHPIAQPPIEPPELTATLSPASTFIPSEPPPLAPPRPFMAPPAPEAPHAAPPLESSSGRSIIADAFSALLAAEQGESTTAAPLRLSGNGSAAPVVTDAMIDDVARRVIQRLALGSSDQMQAIVKDIVSGVAERLVREEIDRIRRNAGPS